MPTRMPTGCHRNTQGCRTDATRMPTHGCQKDATRMPQTAKNPAVPAAYMKKLLEVTGSYLGNLGIRIIVNEGHGMGRYSRKAAYSDVASTGTCVCVLILFACELSSELSCVVGFYSKPFNTTRVVCCLTSPACGDSRILVLVGG